MGIAIRTGSPLSLNLAEPVWKQLAGMTLTPADLTEIDRDYVPGELNFFFPPLPTDGKSLKKKKNCFPGLLCIRDMDPSEKVFQTLEMPFSTPSASGVDVPLSTRYRYVTIDNRQEYVRLALNCRYVNMQVTTPKTCE